MRGREEVSSGCREEDCREARAEVVVALGENDLVEGFEEYSWLRALRKQDFGDGSPFLSVSSAAARRGSPFLSSG